MNARLNAAFRPAAFQPGACTADDVDTLARTLWGEARGEGEDAMEAVAAAIVNRWEVTIRLRGRHWWGGSIAAICRAGLEFACWRPGNPVRAELLALGPADRDFRRAHAIAATAAAGLLPDPVLGATAYKPAAEPWPPAWGRPRLPLAVIGGRAFFNLRD